MEVPCHLEDRIEGAALADDRIDQNLDGDVFRPEILDSLFKLGEPLFFKRDRPGEIENVIRR
jgi:hypothetical protein